MEADRRVAGAFGMMCDVVSSLRCRALHGLSPGDIVLLTAIADALDKIGSSFADSGPRNLQMPNAAIGLAALMGELAEFEAACRCLAGSGQGGASNEWIVP
jgi:hypothetical protein